MQVIWRENELEFTGEIKNSQKQPNDKFILQYKKVFEAKNL